MGVLYRCLLSIKAAHFAPRVSMSWELPSASSAYIPNIRGQGYSEAGGQTPVAYDKADGTRVYTTKEEYNRSRLEGRPRTRPRVRYKQPDISSPYSRTRTQAPRLQSRYDQPVQETSFTEAAHERNPGLRRRLPGQTTEGQQGGQTAEGARVPASRGPLDTRINIPEALEESAPLLGTTATSGLGFSGSSLLTAGTVGTAAGLGLGAAVSSIASRYKDKGAVLPGTDYVGPGNPINIDAPRHASDVIAKEHDIGYDDIIKKARAGNLTEQEFAAHIEQLDNDAIAKFAENFRTSGEWQSFVGRWGLYFKNRIERVTGPLYPSFPGKTWANGAIYHLVNELIGIN